MQFDLRRMAEHMGGVAWGVVIVLFIMSIYSIAVMIERYCTYKKATEQSRKYAPDVARFLKAGQDQGSHRRLPRRQRQVLAPGQGARRSASRSGSTSRSRVRPTADKEAAVDAAKRAIQRATAVNLADLKRGLSGLATIGSTAPFVGLFGTTFGIINAFSGMALTGSGGIAAISAGIAEALITTAFGLFVAVPAVWAYNYFSGQGRRLQRRDGQLQLRAARLLHQEGRLGPSDRGRRGRSAPRCPGLPSRESLPCRWHVGGKQGRGDRGHQRHAHGRHHDRAAHHLHGDHAHAAEGRGREAAHRRATPRSARTSPRPSRSAVSKDATDLPERHQARQPGRPAAAGQGAPRGPARTAEGRLPEGRRGARLLRGHEGHGLLPRGGRRGDRPHRRAQGQGS